MEGPEQSGAALGSVRWRDIAPGRSEGSPLWSLARDGPYAARYFFCSFLYVVIARWCRFLIWTACRNARFILICSFLRVFGVIIHLQPPT